MEQIFDHYNRSVGDVVKLKKKIQKVQKSQPVKKRPTYQEGDDGWVTVHHKRDKKVPKKQRKEKERILFYSFEVKEAKLQKHKELLAQFENDKKKLQKMREQRKFKI